MRLLLDAHISPAVARGLTRYGIDILALRDWMGGDYRSAPDDRLLTAAASDGRVLVSYDCRTLPLLLREWAETGQHHAGVILVDERTVQSNEIGGLVRALRVLIDAAGAETWLDRVVYLRAH